jgi:TrpR family transcriptional regulator, trp operon repressor
VELLKALLKGDKPQRSIADELKISIAKISRGSNALKIIKPSLRKYLIQELL